MLGTPGKIYVAYLDSTVPTQCRNVVCFECARSNCQRHVQDKDDIVSNNKKPAKARSKGDAGASRILLLKVISSTSALYVLPWRIAKLWSSKASEGTETAAGERKVEGGGGGRAKEEGQKRERREERREREERGERSPREERKRREESGERREETGE